MSRSFDVFGAWPKFFFVVNEIQACSAAELIVRVTPQHRGMAEQTSGAFRKRHLRARAFSAGWPSEENAPDNPHRIHIVIYRRFGLPYDRVKGSRRVDRSFCGQFVRSNLVNRAVHFVRRTIAVTARKAGCSRPNLAYGGAIARRGNMRPWLPCDFA